MAKKPTSKKAAVNEAVKKQLASDARGEIALKYHASMKETERTKPELTAAINNLSIVCAGCDGKKVQQDYDGIKVLCPVCNGSGVMPSAFAGGAGGGCQPWNGYPWGSGSGGTFPYPWDNGNLYPTKPYHPPSQIID